VSVTEAMSFAPTWPPLQPEQVLPRPATVSRPPNHDGHGPSDHQNGDLAVRTRRAPPVILEPKVRPELVDEDKLGIGGLPEQEVGKAALSTAANDEIGIGKVRALQAIAEKVRRDRSRIKLPATASAANFRAASANSSREP